MRELKTSLQMIVNEVIYDLQQIDSNNFTIKVSTLNGKYIESFNILICIEETDNNVYLIKCSKNIPSKNDIDFFERCGFILPDEMYDNFMHEIMKNFFSKFKQYRFFSGDLKVNKIFNHGTGALILFKFDFENRQVFVNTAIANKSDYNKLDTFLKEQNANFNIVKKHIGYPDYYFKTL